MRFLPALERGGSCRIKLVWCGTIGKSQVELPDATVQCLPGCLFTIGNQRSKFLRSSWAREDLERSGGFHFQFCLKDLTMGSSSDWSAQEEAIVGFGSGGGSDGWVVATSWALPQTSSMTPKVLMGVSQSLFLLSRRNGYHPWRMLGKLYEMQVKIPFLSYN